MTKRQEELTFSLIVPTFNRCSYLLRCLEAVAHFPRTAAPFEVIVTIDGSTDGTQQALAELHPSYPLRVLVQDNAGPAAARNHAVAAATGDVLLFLDDDVIPAEGLIEQHRLVHRRDPNVVVIGPMLPPPATRMAPWLKWEAATLQRQYDQMLAGVFQPTWRQFYTANASVRREHVLKAGGFDETYRRAEDIELARRLAQHGLRFQFVPTAAVLHEPDRTFDGWLRVAFEYGRCAARSGRHDLQLAFSEFSGRHALTRWISRWCVGHTHRTTAIVAAARLALAMTAPAPLSTLQLALCSGVYSIQYWCGIAQALSVGAGLWHYLEHDDQTVPAENVARTSSI